MNSEDKKEIAKISAKNHIYIEREHSEMLFSTILSAFITSTRLALPLVPRYSLPTVCSLHRGNQSHNKPQVFA